MEIGVLGNDGQAVLFCKGPNDAICGMFKPLSFDVSRIGIQIDYLRDNPIGKVLIK